MLKNRSNKEKFLLVSAGIGILIWLSYQFTFSRTIGLWKECKRLEEQQTLIHAIPEQLPALTEKIARLEQLLGNSGSEDFSTLILEEVNFLCQKYGVTLKEIPEKHIFSGKGLTVETLNINLEGKFDGQLPVISELTGKSNGAKLRSVNFQSIVDQLTGERTLQCTLFLQSIKLMGNNSNATAYEKFGN